MKALPVDRALPDAMAARLMEHVGMDSLAALHDAIDGGCHEVVAVAPFFLVRGEDGAEFPGQAHVDHRAETCFQAELVKLKVALHGQHHPDQV